MTETPSYGALEEHRETFDRIWWQWPERQNRSSSSWWFFILFPADEDGYGPRQLMFVILSRMSERIRVNDVVMPGMDIDRPIEDGVDRFNALSLGWYADGREVHHPIVCLPATTTLSREGLIVGWADQDGARRGGEIRASADRSLGLDAQFVGDGGAARFEAWGELDCPVTSPAQEIDVDTVAGNIHLVSWRRLQFEGQFELPGGRERLRGLATSSGSVSTFRSFPGSGSARTSPTGRRSLRSFRTWDPSSSGASTGSSRPACWNGRPCPSGSRPGGTGRALDHQ